MIVRVYEVVHDRRPLVFEKDGDREDPIATAVADAATSKLIPPGKDDTSMVRSLTQSKSYDVLINKIRTPSFETSLRIVEQEDGSIAIRILGVEVHIVPDTLPSQRRAVRVAGVAS